MKKSLFLGFFGFALGCVFLNAQTLDESIRQAAAEMSERLSGGSTVAVISFQSPAAGLTEYVIDELNGAIVRIGRIRAVERRRLEAIRGELQFNISGEVSDESAQSIGRILGAQTIIMGSLQTIGAIQRIRFQAISTEDAVIQHVFSEDVSSDSVLTSLLGDSVPPPDDSSGGGFFSALSVKFSAGLVFGFTYAELKEYSYIQNVESMSSESGFIMNLVNPTVNVRFLFSFGDKLQLGFGVDLTFGLVRYTFLKDFFPDDRYYGSLCNYWIQQCVSSCRV